MSKLRSKARDFILRAYEELPFDVKYHTDPVVKRADQTGGYMARRFDEFMGEGRTRGQTRVAKFKKEVKDGLIYGKKRNEKFKAFLKKK